MKIGYLNDKCIPEIISDCICFHPSNIPHLYKTYASVSDLIDGITLMDVDVGIVKETELRSFRDRSSHPEEKRIQVAARFLIKETVAGEEPYSDSFVTRYTLYTLIY